MSKKSLLTIFVITYNHEKTIRGTLDGILNQKTNFPFIVKILEDCSTDNTLKICQEYVQKYPSTFQLIYQKENTKGYHIYKAMCNEINTPYFCFIEGDDYYINSSWIEKGISFLQSHLDYNSFVGTVVHKGDNFEKTSIECQNTTYEKVGHDLSFDNYLYLQTSARMYRKIFDFRIYGDFISGDIYLYYLYLDKGKVYYDHNIMSVYRVNTNGTWNSLTTEEKNIQCKEVAIKGCELLGNRHARFFWHFFSDPKSKKIKKLFGYKIALFYEKLKYIHEKKLEVKNHV